MPHVLVAGKIHDAGIDLLRQADGVSFDLVDEVSTESYAPLIGRADAVVIRTQPMPASVISQALRLQIVSRHGVGYDAVDVNALNERRIPLAVCGDVNSLSVAEHTMMLMLAVAKRVVTMHNGVRDGGWAVRTRYDGVELGGRTLLLLGFGRIGRHVGRLASAFGMKVLAHDPHQSDEQVRSGGAEPARDLAASWGRADVVSVHSPKVGDAPLIGATEIAQMRRDAIIVNTSRGGLVDPGALIRALDEGRLSGAGLDVFDPEPPPPGSPILRHERLVLSPHTAGLTAEASMRMAVGAVSNVLKFFEGRVDPTLIVNRAELSQPTHVHA